MTPEWFRRLGKVRVASDIGNLFQNWLRTNRARFVVLAVVVIGILADTFFFDFTSDFVILFLTLLWILAVSLYKFGGRTSIGIGLAFLALCPFLLIFKVEAIAEKAAIWAYMFLVVGVVQQVIEYRREKKDARVEKLSKVGDTVDCED